MFNFMPINHLAKLEIKPGSRGKQPGEVYKYVFQHLFSATETGEKSLLYVAQCCRHSEAARFGIAVFVQTPGPKAVYRCIFAQTEPLGRRILIICLPGCSSGPHLTSEWQDVIPNSAPPCSSCLPAPTNCSDIYSSHSYRRATVSQFYVVFF